MNSIAAISSRTRPIPLRFLPVLSLILLLLPSLVIGQDKELISKARSGDPQAQYDLGAHYFKSKEYSRAVRMWAQAAKGGNVDAQNNLAGMYAKGLGVEKDLGKAIEWWKKAAEGGQPKAQYMMGLLYARGQDSKGQGVPKDIEKAVRWWTNAAEKREPRAQYMLGMLYLKGEGVPKNVSKSTKLITQSAEQGYARAQVQMGVNYLTGRGVQKDTSRALEWLQKAVKQNNVDAMRLMGDMHHAGVGVDKDRSKAIEWWTKAADMGDEKSKEKLAAANSETQASKKTKISDERKRKYEEIKRIEDSYVTNNILDKRYDDNCGRYLREAEMLGEKIRCLKRAISILDNGIKSDNEKLRKNLESQKKNLESQKKLKEEIKQSNERIKKADEIRRIEDSYVKNNITDKRYLDNCARYYHEAKMGGERKRCLERVISILKGIQR